MEGLKQEETQTKGKGGVRRSLTGSYLISLSLSHEKQMKNLKISNAQSCISLLFLLTPVAPAVCETPDFLQ